MKKSVLLLTFVLIFGLMLAACGGTPGPAPAPVVGERGAPVEETRPVETAPPTEEAGPPTPAGRGRFVWAWRPPLAPSAAAAFIPSCRRIFALVAASS